VVNSHSSAHQWSQQARSVADLITESAGHGLVAWRNREDEVFARPVDDARWIAARDSLLPSNGNLLAHAGPGLPGLDSSLEG
jgi:hypothetical protein